MSIPHRAVRPPPARIGALLLIVALGACAADAPHLRVADLVATARDRYPTAAAATAAVRAAEARRTQAGSIADPEIGMSIGRTRPRIAGLDADVPFGIQVAQRLPWRPRTARLAAADAGVALAAAEGDLAARELEIEVRLAAIALASAREAEVQADEQAGIAEDLAALAVVRADAGDIDRLALARLRLEATTVRIQAQVARGRSVATLAILRTWCGEELPAGLVIDDALVDPSVAPSAADADHPALHAARAAERAAAAEADAERQGRVPDVVVGLQAEREQEKDTLAVSLGVTVPLWNRNSGRIAEAEAERAVRAARLVALRAELRRTQLALRGEAEAAAAALVALRDEALPAADGIADALRAGFALGDAGAAEVLEARRARALLQRDLLDARRRYAEAQARLTAYIPLQERP